MLSTFYCHDSPDKSFLEMCLRSGIPVETYDPSSSFSDNDYFVCSAHALLTEGSKLLTESIRAAHVLIISDRSADTERAMLDTGLVLSLTGDRFIKNAAALARSSIFQKGSLLCIGTSQSDSGVIENIGKLFGYSTIYAGNIEEAVTAINGNIVLVIHDLSCQQIDQFQFVKRMSHSALKSIPYIVYKSSGSRIDMSDIQSGIKSFTRMILAENEAYALLAVNLFKKEYYPLISRLASRQSSDLLLFGSESLKKIYFANNDSFFTEHPDTVCDSVDESGIVCNEMESLIARFECIRWLVEKKDISPRIIDASSAIQK